MGMVYCARLVTQEDVIRLTANTDAIYDFVCSPDGYESGHSIEFDKEWHALHYLLTKSAGSTDSALNLIIGDYPEIGDDNGYGPAQFISKEVIASFNVALGATTDEQLASQYDSDGMVRDDVYLADTLHEEGEEALGFLMQHVARLRSFASRGASEGLSGICLIT